MKNKVSSLKRLKWVILYTSLNSPSLIFALLRSETDSLSLEFALSQSICYEKAGDWPNKNRNFTVQNLNKRPKGPHIVHLSTMWPAFWQISQGRIFVYSSAWKHKLGRRRWDLASCQVSFNSVQRFQRRRRKCPSQSEARAAILFFRSARKTQTW